jgi:glutamate carboxypeptidase
MLPTARQLAQWRIHRSAALALAGLLFCTAVLADTAGSQRTAAAERALVSYVQAREQRSIALLEEIVNVNSGTMNFAGVSKVAELLRPQFEALGFRTRWIDGAPFGRAGHLIAERPGRGRHVLLIGHLDTVFEPNHPFQRFERVDANIARGPGTADMKGGIIVALAALGALHEAKALDDLQLTIVLHGDEEDSGKPLALARAALIDAAKAADIAIGLENAADDPKTAVIARRGSSSWKLEITARSAHSSQIFTDEVGAGAIYELARVLDGFYRELRGEQYVTFNPGLIAGSTQVQFETQPLRAQLSGKDNIIAPQAVASGDLRTLTREQLEQTKERMSKIAAAALPHTTTKISFSDSYPPMAPTAGNRRLLSMYDAVSRDLGFGPVSAVDPRRAGAADISFAADHVEMAIDGLGLLGGGSHTPEEFADLRNLPIQAQRLAVLLFRLGKL